MQYMMLIHEDESAYEGEDGERAMEETLAGHGALIEALNAAGLDWSGERLAPAGSATTIKWDHGAHSLHDGSFAETHEELGGYYIVDLPDLDAALEWARKIPIPGKGAVEVRPVIQD